jgi:glutamate synthase (NADPH/NADH) small chain
VAIVGSGPSGLAAAELLRRYGHSVTVFEELSSPGGTAWYGIPDYHLPKDVLQYEVDRIKGMGVEIRTGIKVGGEKMSLADLEEKYDAVLITTGAKDPTPLKTPGLDLQGVYSGYDFLQTVFGNGLENYLKNPKFDLGREIVVIGGGDSSLDCARTALRLSGGIGNVTLTYRRSENDMPADPVMLEEAKEEGVNFRFQVEPRAYEGVDGRLTSVLMDTMELGEPDESGRRSPEPVPGKEFRIPCSAVLLAVGRGPNSFLQKQAGLKIGRKNSIDINEFFETSEKKIFSAGDVTGGETLVVKAMDSGREAAQRVHEFLMNLRDQHISFYERYYKQNLYDRMLEGSVSHQMPPD